MTSIKPLLLSPNQSNWEFYPSDAGPTFLKNKTTAGEHWTNQMSEFHVDSVNGTATYAPSDNVRVYQHCDITSKKFLVFILCVFGFLGNCFTILVLRRDPEKENAIIWLLKALAVVDNIYLSFAFLESAGLSIEWAFGGWTDKAWRLYIYVTFFQYPMSAIIHTLTVWIVVLITVDRYLGICKPINLKWRKLRRMKLTFLWLLILAILLNVPLFSFGPFYELLLEECLIRNNTISVETTESSFCATIEYLLNRVLVVYDAVLYVIIRSFGPLLILIILNIRISMALRAMERKRRHMKQQINRERTIIKMLAVVVVVFFLCQMPEAFVDIFFATSAEFYFPDSLSCILIISHTLLVLNSSINFLIYCLMNRRFKRIFCNMLPCRACTRQRATIIV